MGHKVWGYDPNPEAMPGVIHASTLNAVLDNSEAVIIASPTKEHLYHLDRCLIRKLPTFVEKPIAHGELPALDQMRYHAEAFKTPLMVGNNLRFSPCVQQAKSWLVNGLIGQPKWASFKVCQHTDKDPYKRDGVWLNWLSHEVDLALYLLGPATVTAATGTEEIADMCLLHEYGVPSTVHGDYVTRPYQRRFMVGSDTGVIHCNLEGRQVFGINYPDGIDGGTNIESLIDPTTISDDYRAEIQAFCDLIDGKPVPHAATGADGLACLELILQAQQMAAK
jgi:predicted dehydrogenase